VLHVLPIPTSLLLLYRTSRKASASERQKSLLNEMINKAAMIVCIKPFLPALTKLTMRPSVNRTWSAARHGEWNESGQWWSD